MKSHITRLIEKAASGDKQAQTDIYEAYNPRFEGYAYRLLLRKHCPVWAQHMGGAVNAAWGKIFKGLPGLKSSYKFNRWALKIVRNSLYTHLRQCIRQQKEISFGSLGKRSSDDSGERYIPFDPPSASPFLGSREDVIFSGILANEVLSIAATINEKLPDILYLRFFEGLDELSISERIGKSYDNTRTIYSRGIKRLVILLGAEKKRQLKKKFPRERKDDIDS